MALHFCIVILMLNKNLDRCKYLKQLLRIARRYFNDFPDAIIILLK